MLSQWLYLRQNDYYLLNKNKPKKQALAMHCKTSPLLCKRVYSTLIQAEWSYECSLPC